MAQTAVDGRTSYGHTTTYSVFHAFCVRLPFQHTKPCRLRLANNYRMRTDISSESCEIFRYIPTMSLQIIVSRNDVENVPNKSRPVILVTNLQGIEQTPKSWPAYSDTLKWSMGLPLVTG